LAKTKAQLVIGQNKSTASNWPKQKHS